MIMEIRKQLDEIIKVSNEVTVVNNVVMYFFNTAPADIVEMLFGEVYGGYDKEWIARYQQGFNVFWSRLDEGNRQKFVDAAMEKYG
jgi:hypothetical protein|tara:strand:- start:88 stop:345 length:258 start_codon:yes stop_codon:yes gene_type:complete